jgi:hypothetical protein
MALAKPPRSVRNNNPGNLRNGIRWDGLSTLLSDPDFCVFASPIWGFRALAIDLHTAWTRGFDTLDRLITHYAPPSENNTVAYIVSVSTMMGVEMNAPLNLDDDGELTSLVRAIAVHEAGGWFFSTSDLTEGIRLARVAIAPPEPAIA